MNDSDLIRSGDTQDSEERKLQLAETRAKRLQDVADGYEVYDGNMPDATVPGAARVVTSHDGKLVRKHPRYVLVTQYGDQGNYRLYLGDDVANVEQLAAQAATDSEGGELVHCYFDLDVLAGDELPPEVEVNGVEWTVHGLEFVAGEYTGKWVLKRSPDDRRRRTYDWSTVDPSECDLMGWEDERMPVRYGVAKVITHVVFNTIPTEA